MLNQITSEAIEATKKGWKLKIYGKCQIVNSDAENLPIKDDSLDFIWSWGNTSFS